MTRSAILLLSLLCCACGVAEPRYVARYDLDQLASETVLRDSAPGFTALPETSMPKVEG